MIDNFDNQGSGLSSPAERFWPITPGAGELAEVTRYLWVGIEGSVEIEAMDGTSATFVGVSGLLPVRAAKVLSGSAGSILGLA